MSRPIYYGAVVSAQGVNPGPALGITYTVKMDGLEGGTFTVQGIVPINRSLGNIDINAAAPGRRVRATEIVPGTLEFEVFGEEPASDDCEGAAPLMSPEMNLLLEENRGNTVFAGDSNDTPAGGGVIP